MPIADGQDIIAEDHDNIYHAHGNMMLGKGGTLKIPVFINNVTGERTVKIALWGNKAGPSAGVFHHGILADHHHSLYAQYGTSTGFNTENENGRQKILNIGDSNFAGDISVGNVVQTGDTWSAPLKTDPFDYTNVPKYAKIYIDGVDKTQAIGDPNAKGATMYDSVNYRWGINGTTEWDTGWLDISSLITWTAGWHYITIVEAGGVGGILIYHVSVNTGTS